MIYKILLVCNFLPWFVLFFLHTGCSSAQTLSRPSSYGVSTVADVTAFQSMVKADSSQKVIELRSLAPALVYDLRYATSNNFMHRRMYPAHTRYTFLRLLPAQALAAVQQELVLQGYGLKIFDAYRPYAVTVRFWELVKDERYVANPSKGSGHNRGLAVDLTLIQTESGKELDMGTGFDNFSDSAHQSFKGLPETILKNRALLRSAMVKHGFTPLETEWWHYYWPNDRNYAVLDLTFEELFKTIK